MQIERYQASHFDIICDWLSARNMDAKLASEPPEIGFIAFDDKTPVCAAFIRRVEGGIGLLENLVTNPKADSLVRHVAIDLIVERIIEEAKAIKLTGLLAYSEDNGTLKRSIGHGFRVMPHVLITLNLLK